jgi:hypothetical protein
MVAKTSKTKNFPLLFFAVDPGSGKEKPGSGIKIPDPQHCFAGTVWHGTGPTAA